VKVAIVLPGGLDRRNEAWVIPYLFWMVERLARRHELHIYAIHRKLQRESYQFAGAMIHALGRPLTEARAVTSIVAEHRRRPFDLLHAFWAQWPGTVAGVAGRLIRRPVLLHLAGGELVALRDIGYGGGLKWRWRAAVRFALRSASRVSAPSGPMRALAQEMGCATTELPFGVDLERWPARPPRPRDRQRPARLLHVGTLNRVKDHSTLLEAAGKLQARGVSFRLDLVGEDILDGAIPALARRLGLGGTVAFHGYLLHGQLRPLVEQADLLLVSSRHEAGPMAMLEAAVAGVPTVGTAVGHVRDWAPDAAVAVPVQDAEGLARETQALLEDDARRVQLATKAQQRALARDADWTVHAIESLYGDMVSRTNGRV
jgi:glycosyltransferase involved in cell wall biosynthesis